MIKQLCKSCIEKLEISVEIGETIGVAPCQHCGRIKEVRPVIISKYGFSVEHDQILEYCIAHYGACPFGCTKDGAPNCYYNSIVNRDCEPSKALLAMMVRRI